MSIYFSVDFIEDESQEHQGQYEGICVRTPKNGITIDLTVTTESVLISADNTEDESV